MSIYLFKNDQQTGPYEDRIIIDQMQSGLLSPDDLAIRHGAAAWQKLGDLFPGVTAAQPEPVDTPVVPSTPTPSVSSEPASLYRKTIFHKVFFGLAFLGALVCTIAAVAYWQLFLGPSGDLMADLGNAAFRDLAVYCAIAFFGMTVLTFLALLLCFKRKIIRTSGLRVVLRLFFILAIVIGVLDVGYGVFTYLNWRPTVSSSSSRSSSGDEMLKALEDGEKLAGPLLGPGIHFPIGIGFILLGLSGFAMTKSSGTPEP